MKCEKCGMIFFGNDKVCPRCFEPIQNNNKMYKLLNTRVKISNKFYLSSFQLITILVVNLCLFLLLTNVFVYNKDHPSWSVFAITPLIILNIFLSYFYKNRRLLVVGRHIAIVLEIALVILEYTYFKNGITMDYVIPSLHILFNIGIIVALIFFKANILRVIFTSVVNFIMPLISFVLMLVGIIGIAEPSRIMIFISFLFSLFTLLNSIIFLIISFKNDMSKLL